VKKSIHPFASLALMILGWIAVYALVQVCRPLLEAAIDPQTEMQKVALRLTGSAAFLWGSLAIALLVLRLSGETLADIGFRGRGAWPGWVLALVIAALHVAMLSMGPLRHPGFATDWSLLRIYSSVIVATAAGVCEEGVFRGFVMTKLQQARVPLVLQVMASAILFGLAHAGWGFVSGEANYMAAMGAMISTSILGLLLAICFALSKRSLWPVVVAHGVIDLIEEPWLMIFAMTGGFGP